MGSTLFVRRAERSLGGASTIAAAAGILAQKADMPTIDAELSGCKPTVIKNAELASFFVAALWTTILHTILEWKTKIVEKLDYRET